MAYQRLQVGRALPIVPCDDFEIPQIASVQNVVNGVATAPGGPNSLKDTTKDFVALGVQVGDTVITEGNLRTVSGFIGTDALLLTGTGGSVSAGESYVIYNVDAQGAKNNGCTLYIGLAGNVTVETFGGDVVTFTGMPTGSFVPVHVLKVKASGTTAQSILALW